VTVGKYPHLTVASDGITINSPHFELLVDYGSVPVGQNVEKWIEVINLSPVRKLLRIASILADLCCVMSDLQQYFHLFWPHRL